MQFSGVEITHKDQEFFVKRAWHQKCKKLAITPETIFSGNFAANDVAKECKRSFVMSLGTIQPMKIDNDIETVGELEVLRFLEVLEFEPEKYALVDSRNIPWYEMMTIPNAINIPFSDIQEDKDLSKEYHRALQLLNIQKDQHGKLDFSQAKNVIVFCNANWCVQSVWAIKSLIKMGYPKHKISWYRGGLQDWAGSGFTTIQP